METKQIDKCYFPPRGIGHMERPRGELCASILETKNSRSPQQVTKNKFELRMRERYYLFIVMIIVPLPQMATDIYFPSLPAIALNFGASAHAMMLSVSVFLFGLGISQLFYGYFSDRMGRRPIIIMGIALFIIATMLCIFSHRIHEFIAYRLLQGLGIGAGSIIPKAVITDLYRGKKLSIIILIMTMIWSLTTIVSPALGGIIQQYFNWKANFYILLMYSVVLLIAIFIFSLETLPAHISEEKIFKLNVHENIFRNRIFITNTLCMSVLFSIIIAFNSSSSFIFQKHFNLAPKRFGFIIMLIGLSYFIGSIINLTLLKNRINYDILAKIGFFWMITCNTLLVIFSNNNIAFIIIAMGGVMMGLSLVYPICMSRALNAMRVNAGMASAVIGCSLMICSSVVIQFISRIENLTINKITLFILSLSTISGIIYRFSGEALPERSRDHI